MAVRAHNRLPANIGVNFYLGSTRCSGTLTNLSAEGMCLKTGTFLSCELGSELLICLRNGVLNVPVRVSWIEMEDSFHDSLGVEAVNPSREYNDFVKDFGTC